MRLKIKINHFYLVFIKILYVINRMQNKNIIFHDFEIKIIYINFYTHIDVGVNHISPFKRNHFVLNFESMITRNDRNVKGLLWETTLFSLILQLITHIKRNFI